MSSILGSYEFERPGTLKEYAPIKCMQLTTNDIAYDSSKVRHSIHVEVVVKKTIPADIRKNLSTSNDIKAFF